MASPNHHQHHQQIEPTHYDAAVVSSGLLEVLLAAALARAGRAVLLLDASDAYGGSWASLSGADFVHGLVNSSLVQQQCQQPQEQQQQEQLPPGAIAVRQPAPLGGVQHASLFAAPQLEQALQDRGLIIDLAPRVLFQDEPLVQLLVSCQAHNYLEFKLVEGSYVWMDGRLHAVPASRAGLFADRALPLADKRSLGRFMAACVEAVEGSGRLKDAFNGRPLINLLAAEGLNERLQAVVLYGIAMADVPQQQQQPQEAAAAAATPYGLVTAAQGLAALELYSRSLGRHGGSGAFMAPCYGSGSLTEAFVRLAAVKGAVTALRHATQQLQRLPGEQEAAAPAAAGQAESAGAGHASTPDAANSSKPAAAASEAAAATAPARVRLMLASGQALTAGTVISSASDLTSCGGASRPQHRAVARAVAVLDRSLVEGDTSLLLVIPPGTLGPEQAAVIRGLQLGHALAVAPPGHFLLYLSAVLPDGAAGAAAPGTPLAEQVLRPALEALAAMQDLQPFGAPLQPEEASAVSSSSCSAAAQSREQQKQQEQEPAAAGCSGSRARALAACFFMVHETHEAAAQQVQPPEHIVRCAPAPAAGFAGFTPSIAAAEDLFRQHFPDLPWLTEPLAKPAAAAAGSASTLDQEQQGAGEAGGRVDAGHAGAGGYVDEDELDAIDELTAALADLSAGLEPDAPPLGSS